MTSLSQATLLMLRENKVLVLGIGLTGLSCARFLTAHNISFAVNDSRDAPIVDLAQFAKAHNNAELALGAWHKNLIANADIILVSPGIDLAVADIANALKKDCQIWGDVELYCRLTDTPILAVTGSNGKSTVVSLLTHLGKALGYQVALGGNVGIPVLDHLVEQSEKLDMLVLELSSFQLESLSSMQAVAGTVLNVSDDHLDRHLTLENYQHIKQTIYQQSHIAITNRDDKRTLLPSNTGHKNVQSFGSDKPDKDNFGITTIDDVKYLMFGEQTLIAIHALPLAGIHNALNCLAALALGHSSGWSLSAMVDHLSTFKGLAHRCQRIASKDEVVWINDSKATNVGATLAAINGFAQVMQPSAQLILIAGGEGKGADFKPLKTVITEKVAQLITLGKDGDKIAKLSKHAIRVTSLEQAVAVASRVAKPHDTVLLSPACASLDMFKNFAERGQVFIDAVKQLKAVS